MDNNDNNNDNENRDDNSKSEQEENNEASDTASKVFERPDLIVANVIARPVWFFQNMPKQGTMGDAMLFVVLIGFFCWVLQYLLIVIGVRPAEDGAVALMFIFPLSLVFESGFFYFVWMIMGSKQSFTTTFRIISYLFAIAPLAIVLSPVPYLSIVALTIWKTVLLAIVTIEVHKIGQKKTFTVFSIYCAFLIYAQIFLHDIAVDIQKEEMLKNGDGKVLSSPEDDSGKSKDRHLPFSDEEVMKDPFAD